MFLYGSYIIRDIYNSYNEEINVFYISKEGTIMKDFFKDYLKICKDCGKFYKRNWKGVIIIKFFCIVVMFIPYVYNKIEEKILSKWYEERVKEMDNEKGEES